MNPPALVTELASQSCVLGRLNLQREHAAQYFQELLRDAHRQAHVAE